MTIQTLSFAQTRSVWRDLTSGWSSPQITLEEGGETEHLDKTDGNDMMTYVDTESFVSAEYERTGTGWNQKRTLTVETLSWTMTLTKSH